MSQDVDAVVQSNNNRSQTLIPIKDEFYGDSGAVRIEDPLDM